MSVGAVRTQFEAGITKQRRRFKNLPHIMSLRWVVNQPTLTQLVEWINANGYEPFTIDLPSELAGQKGKPTWAHEVRVVSDIATNLIKYSKDKASDIWWEVGLQVEWMKYGSTVLPAGNWIIARTPGNPSPDWYIARRPGNPSTDIIYPGSPAAPAAHI
jgi:hypothetical protein